MSWLEVNRGDAPLLVTFPHTGSDLPDDVAGTFVSPWLARRDADWWLEQLYEFAKDLGATTVRTRISRSVIDVNRDPSGASLYPGQATTELCPTTTFDGEALHRDATPDDAEIARRRAAYFDPYHAAIDEELARLGARHPRVMLYDAHSIRSRIPRLFDGELPQLNVGTNDGATCDQVLEDAVADVCARSGRSHVVNGRFRGGWTTRHYGQPHGGIHAIQMELACRGYMAEPTAPDEQNWPPHYDASVAAPLQRTLRDVLSACLAFATSPSSTDARAIAP